MQGLQSRLQDSEQHSRCSGIEIQGLPLTRDESIYELLSYVPKANKVRFNQEDISIAHRLRLLSKKHSHPPIIVQFTFRSVKDDSMFFARGNEDLGAEDVRFSF